MYYAMLRDSKSNLSEKLEIILKRHCYHLRLNLTRPLLNAVAVIIRINPVNLNCFFQNDVNVSSKNPL
jgi:hypothetical protein